MRPAIHDLTAHGDACRGCRMALEEAVAIYRETSRRAIAGDHPSHPSHRGGCWAEYETTMRSER